MSFVGAPRVDWSICPNRTQGVGLSPVFQGVGLPHPASQAWRNHGTDSGWVVSKHLRSSNQVLQNILVKMFLAKIPRSPCGPLTSKPLEVQRLLKGDLDCLYINCSLVKQRNISPFKSPKDEFSVVYNSHGTHALYPPTPPALRLPDPRETASTGCFASGRASHVRRSSAPREPRPRALDHCFACPDY